jgi:hypothetical protein
MYAHRDFANGFLIAEVLSRYYPSDIEMHSFENVTSMERKRANWVVLEKLFKVRPQLWGEGGHRRPFRQWSTRRYALLTLRSAPAAAASLSRNLLAPSPPPSPCMQRRSIPVDSQLVEAVITAEGDAASDLLQLLYAFINSDAYT